MKYKEFKEWEEKTVCLAADLVMELNSLENGLPEKKKEKLVDKGSDLLDAIKTGHNRLSKMFYSPLNEVDSDKMYKELGFQAAVNICQAVEDILTDGSTKYLPENPVSEKWLARFKNRIAEHDEIFKRAELEFEKEKLG